VETAAQTLWIRSAPNPFAVSTRLRYFLASEGTATLEVFDVSGRHVRTLADGPVGAGEHFASWDGRDEKGHTVASGVYFARIETENDMAATRLLLLR
jgi:flagellar hook assembly protein FlgD